MSHNPVGAGKSSYDMINAALLFDAIQWKPDMTVLDLACGAGNYTLAMARRSEPPGRIIAVDLWEEGIFALDKAARSIPNVAIETHVADVRGKLPVDDAGVDLCLMATVLHDLVAEGGEQAALKEVDRVLKPDGVLAVVELKKQDGGPGPPKAVRLRMEEVSALLLRIGFLRFSAVVDLGPEIYFAQFRRLSQAGKGAGGND